MDQSRCRAGAKQVQNRCKECRFGFADLLSRVIVQVVQKCF